MSGVLRLAPGAAKADPLEPEVARAVVEGGAARADAVAAMARTTRRLAWAVGAAGAAAGVLGVGAAAWMAVAAGPPRTYFAVLDPATATVQAALPAGDAPRRFGDGTARQYLRLFVEACAGWNFELKTENYRRCEVLLSPRALAKYRELISLQNPNSPQVRFGSAYVLSASPTRYDRLPAAGAEGGGGVQSWLVHYTVAQRRDGADTALTGYSVTVHFRWAPGAPMTDDQRTLNAAGFQVVDFAFGRGVGS